MGPPDENLILGSDPAVLSSPSYPALGNSILHISHQITAQRSNVMVVYIKSEECSTCTMLHWFDLEILILLCLVLFANG